MVFPVPSHIALSIFLSTCFSAGAKEAGAAGFFKGLGKGVVGVLARPAGGLVDFASSTLEGIKGLVPSSKYYVSRVMLDLLFKTAREVLFYICTLCPRLLGSPPLSKVWFTFLPEKRVRGRSAGW